MSQIAPDIPELEHVPHALRSIAYLRAQNRAFRAPLTWLIAAVLFALGIYIGATQGARLGTIGGVFGTAAGFALAFVCFFRVILPWRIRLIVPSVTKNPEELEAFDHLRRADESLKQMAAAMERQGPKKPRGPERLPK
jgi:hypothetical protein